MNLFKIVFAITVGSLVLACQSVKKTSSPPPSFVQRVPIDSNPSCTGPATADGYRDGVWWCFYPNGQLKSLSEFENGVQTGSMDQWNLNGSKDFQSEWKNQKLDGPSSLFLSHRCPQIKSIYKEGILHGASTQYDHECRLRAHLNYEMGLLDGPYKEFWSSGQKRIVGQFKLGEEVGVWSFFDCRGKALATEDELEKLTDCPGEAFNSLAPPGSNKFLTQPSVAPPKTPSEQNK